MNDEQQPGSQDKLTREQYRKQATQQGTPQPTPEADRSSRVKPTTKKRGAGLFQRLFKRGPQAAEPDVPQMDQPEQPAQRTGKKHPLTSAEKTTRLAHRLNIAIVVLVVLIVLVYIILRFVG